MSKIRIAFLRNIDFLLFVYRIRAYRPLAVYKNLRVFWWWFIEIFWVFAPKSSKKWALGAKKWWFIQIWLQWWLGPVTPLQILPTNGPDDLYTIQKSVNQETSEKSAEISILWLPEKTATM